MQPLKANDDFNSSTLLTEGRVQSKSGDLWLVVTEQGLFKVRKAFSCLLEPKLGDKVLLQLPPQGSCYLLAILERDQEAAAEIHFNQDVHFHFKGNRCQWLGLSELKLQSLKTDVFSSETNFSANKLTTSGGQATHRWKQVNCLVEELIHAGKLYFQRVTQSVRRIKGVDQKDSEQTLHTARKSLRMHSQQASITSKQDMRIDSKRIHMG
ncbi:Protein of unknown function [Marinospirillum celere]|uniref:DUF3540 domain-containing protein n=1 Tax=Marinospirillum celere TaxID=1122252 RepID=A0A1I1H4P4_9GAMM|nr:DUF3540 domain-containing protein [Marinospirillum celere]SFC18924.1 Protein of unknown function [Marinospirillum celere]